MARTTTATERTTRVTRRSTEIGDGPSRLYSTKNDLPQAARVQVIELLNQRLADSIDLQTQCKQAHWNVKGPAFIALHKLFDEINEDVEEYVDLIAERIVQLGGRRACGGVVGRARRIRADGPGWDRGDERAGGRGQRRHPDRDLPRCRQVVVVRRGAPAGRVNAPGFPAGSPRND